MKRRRLFIALPLLFLLVFPTSAAVLGTWPELGARAASPMRRLIGNQAVAQAETIVFTVQDGARRLQYQLGLGATALPWQPPATSLAPSAGSPATPTSGPTGETPATISAPTALPGATAASTLPALAPASPTPTLTPQPAATETPTPMPQWSLTELTALAGAEGEGIWQPYLTGADGQVVGLRTFLLPDPERPYAVVGIVAIDLSRTRLHYVLGAEEPRLPGGPGGSGLMPAADLESAALLATFNGGFMATHGEYGAMAGNVAALPPKPGFATVTMSADGRVQIGVWGDDIDPDGDYEAWRQNARMIIDDGQVNNRVYNGSITTWGGNINGDIVTWRSGLGMDATGDVLYYFAGPSLSMQSLAAAMQAAGVHNGMLLDINPTWVHFAAIEQAGDELLARPLFDEGMESDPDRFLRASVRDFFYVMLSE